MIQELDQVVVGSFPPTPNLHFRNIMSACQYPYPHTFNRILNGGKADENKPSLYTSQSSGICEREILVGAQDSFNCHTFCPRDSAPSGFFNPFDRNQIRTHCTDSWELSKDDGSNCVRVKGRLS